MAGLSCGHFLMSIATVSIKRLIRQTFSQAAAEVTPRGTLTAGVLRQYDVIHAERPHSLKTLTAVTLLSRGAMTASACSRATWDFKPSPRARWTQRLSQQLSVRRVLGSTLCESSRDACFRAASHPFSPPTDPVTAQQRARRGGPLSG